MTTIRIDPKNAEQVATLRVGDRVWLPAHEMQSFNGAPFPEPCMDVWLDQDRGRCGMYGLRPLTQIDVEWLRARLEALGKLYVHCAPVEVEREAAPTLPPIGSRWRYPTGRIARVIAHMSATDVRMQHVDDKDFACWTELSSSVRTAEEVSCPITHDWARNGATRRVCLSCGEREECPSPVADGSVERDGTIVHPRDRTDARTAGKALVDAAIADPPPGCSARAWRAALYAYEEHAAGYEDGCITDQDIDDARVLCTVYERERCR